MLDNERSGLETRIVGDDLLVSIQYAAHGPVPDGVDPDPPSATHREVGDLDQVARFPKWVPRGVGVVGIGVVERSGKGPSIHEGLEPPDLEQIITEATAYPQAGDVRDLFCDRSW